MKDPVTGSSPWRGTCKELGEQTDVSTWALHIFPVESIPGLTPTFSAKMSCREGGVAPSQIGALNAESNFKGIANNSSWKCPLFLSCISVQMKTDEVFAISKGKLGSQERLRRGLSLFPQWAAFRPSPSRDLYPSSVEGSVLPCSTSQGHQWFFFIGILSWVEVHYVGSDLLCYQIQFCVEFSVIWDFWGSRRPLPGIGRW